MTNLGSCCCCGINDSTVTNLIKLPFVCPQPGTNTGWGCEDCGVPYDGAVSVVCNACMQYVKRGEAPVFVCNGSIRDGRRAPSSACTVPFIHTPDQHLSRKLNMFIGGTRRINESISESVMMAAAGMN